MRKITILLLVAGLALLALPALAQSETPTADPMGEVTPELNLAVYHNPLGLAPTDAISFARFTNVAAGGGPVDLYIAELSDLPLVENLDYGQESGFIMLPAGAYTVNARNAGSTVEDDVIFSLNWEFLQDSSWLVVYAGQEADLTLQLEPVNLLRDDIPDDVARVRVVNFVSGDLPLTLQGLEGDDFAQGLGWMGVADTEMAPGTVSLSVVDDAGTAYATDTTVGLVGGALNTLLLVGDTAGSRPVEVENVYSPESTARVQLVNNTGQPLQIFMRPGDTELIDVLAAGETSEWLTLPPVSVTFVAYAPGTGPTGQELSAWIGALNPLRDVTVTFMEDMSTNVSDASFSPEVDMVEEAQG
jgi:hypothetical protein